MIRKIALTFCGICCLLLGSQAQTSETKVPSIKVTSTEAILLGKIPPVRDLVAKPSTTSEKKDAIRKIKKVPDNFKGRRNRSKAFYKDKEHQGIDPVLQTDYSKMQRAIIEPLVNINGIGVGSPTDPTGDVSDEYYVQAINVTDVAVYDLEGNMIQEFAMSTLWSEIGAISAGDPIILYDENAEKWIVTEFTDPANLLIAISDTKDPLGGYNAYSFGTPNFPDYPKYGLTPEALVVTTNEEGGASLHQYFIDLSALYSGAATVNIQRVEIAGTTGSEQGFYTSTPADWNGTTLPFDNNPIVLRINDSSWAGGPAQDQIELYSFEVDFSNPANTTVTQTSIPTAPFDSYPCSVTGAGFACIPQLNGSGLDAVPEVVMNVPHQRNFGTHESLVFNFVTDATDGDNRSGIRWVELRRTAGTDWSLHQEGTFAPDDGKDRFMGSIAMDEAGNIALGYNISSPDSYASVGFTGRFASDPLGIMTIDEINVVEGMGSINSGGRFGDYSQMSVSPNNDRTFWFTTEYAGNSSQVTQTRIVAVQFGKDTFDLTTRSILEPTTSASLGPNELVTAEIFNAGLTAISNYTIGLIVDGNIVETTVIPGTLDPDIAMTYQFTTPVDLSAIDDYSIGAFVKATEDTNPLNDTLLINVSKIPQLEAAISGNVMATCGAEIPASFTLANLGEDVITTATVDIFVNGTKVDEIIYNGSISYNQSATQNFTITDELIVGTNNFEFKIVSVNNMTDAFSNNNEVSIMDELLGPNDFITLNFNSDEYPDETTWEIYEQGTNNLIASGGLTIQGLSSTQICAPLDACFTLIVYDSFGDGICCSNGAGNFEVLDNTGATIIFNNGEFGYDVTEEFCALAMCEVTAVISIEDASGNANADGSIIIEASGGIAPYSFSIDGGVTSHTTNIFTNLAVADYDIVVTDAGGDCTYTETVTINFSSGLYELNGKTVEVEILPNPTEGVFKVNIVNLEVSNPLLKLEIYDVVGKLVQTRKIAKYDTVFTGTISLLAFPAGTYFLRIANEDINILEKIIKQ